MAIRIDKKYVGILLLLGLMYLTYLVLSPLFNALVWAMILTYLFHPLYRKVKGVIRNERISSLIITLAIVVVSIVSLTLLFNVLSGEIVSTYGFLSTTLNGNASSQACVQNPSICKLAAYISSNPVNVNS